VLQNQYQIKQHVENHRSTNCQLQPNETLHEFFNFMIKENLHEYRIVSFHELFLVLHRFWTHRPRLLF
jgi:hypothetical protein